ncbi:MAG TPA: YeeE/YedE family protein [Gallionellaceae bacterium]|nr:YeeE/YedE family protein [Gallionellaceae bacterium]
MSLATTIVLWGLGLGVLLGIFASKTNFCTMGAVSDIVNMGSWGRMRAWILAIAVAIIGTSILSYLGYLDLSKTIYTGSSFPVLTFLAGGFIFGVGMTLASGCGNKTLLRIGSGNLKSLVVFVFMGIAAIATLKGIFGAFRVSVLTAPAVTMQMDHSQTIPAFFSIGGYDANTVQIIVACVIALAMLIFVFMSKDFRHELDNSIAGISIGLIVIAAWYITGHMGYAENPDTMEMTYMGTASHLAESMSFVAPSAYTLEYLGYWTDTSTVVTFSVASAFGVALGSFLYAIFTKSFRWEYFTSAKDMGSHIIGAIMMGFGGITAMGCTIGQGITGVSTLSLGSFVTLLSIIAGSAVTMKIQYYLMMRED